MSYKQLIEGQRYQIEAYLREGFSYREIGKKLKANHSTISLVIVIVIKRDRSFFMPAFYLIGKALSPLVLCSGHQS
nr:helix-turn-helix domain-containing protein [Pseudoalteromonas sp. 31A1]